MSKMVLVVAAAIGLGAATPAPAAENAMKVCGAKYQAAKTAKTLPAGQTWTQFLAACRAGLAPSPAATPVAAAAAPAARTAPAAAPAPRAARTAAAPRAAGTPTPAQLAERTRQKQCGAQWKSDKAAGKTGTQTWPQYWSACSKRLKGAA